MFILLLPLFDTQTIWKSFINALKTTYDGMNIESFGGWREGDPLLWCKSFFIGAHLIIKYCGLLCIQFHIKKPCINVLHSQLSSNYSVFCWLDVIPAEKRSFKLLILKKLSRFISMIMTLWRTTDLNDETLLRWEEAVQWAEQREPPHLPLSLNCLRKLVENWEGVSKSNTAKWCLGEKEVAKKWGSFLTFLG